MTPLERASDPALYGGKASGLARLLAWGYDVPPGVALSWQEVDAVVEGQPAPDPHVPGPWAVRSSAVGEDGALSSFAGVHETVLDVGPGDLPAALASVHASGRSPMATTYRRQRGLGTRPRMAVVVQQLLRPEVSLVAFAVDPVTGAPAAVVEAAPGPGERLVQGELTPDRWVLAPGGAILRRVVGEEPTGLDDDTVERVARMVEDVSRRSGHPQDMELALADGGLWALQARAVTTL